MAVSAAWGELGEGELLRSNAKWPLLRCSWSLAPVRTGADGGGGNGNQAGPPQAVACLRTALQAGGMWAGGTQAGEATSDSGEGGGGGGGVATQQR